MRPIDADKLKYYGNHNFQYVDRDQIDEAPTIKTKQVKYYDEDESVWKVGSVIVDE